MFTILSFNAVLPLSRDDFTFAVPNPCFFLLHSTASLKLPLTCSPHSQACHRQERIGSLLELISVYRSFEGHGVLCLLVMLKVEVTSGLTYSPR